MENSTRYEAVVIGASAGGMKALGTLFTLLPKDFSLPIIIVKHVHADSDDFLIHYLGERCGFFVKEAEEKEVIQSAHVYIAPPGYHLLIEETKTFSLSIDAPVHFCRPAIDVLFESAGDTYGAGLIGILLTGANSDGSQGLKKIKQSGGLTLVQDPGSAEFDVMPQAAVDAGAHVHVLGLSEIPRFLNGLRVKRLKP